MCFVDTKPRKKKSRAVKPPRRVVHYDDPGTLPSRFDVADTSYGFKTTTVAEAAMRGDRSSTFSNTTVPMIRPRLPVQPQGLTYWNNTSQFPGSGTSFQPWQDGPRYVVGPSAPAHSSEKTMATPLTYNRRPSSLIRDVEGVRKLASRLEIAMRTPDTVVARKSASPVPSPDTTDVPVTAAAAKAEKALCIVKALARQRELELAKKQGRADAERELASKYSGGGGGCNGLCESRSLERHGHPLHHRHPPRTYTRSPSLSHHCCHLHDFNDKDQEAYPCLSQSHNYTYHIHRPVSQHRDRHHPVTNVYHHLVTPNVIQDFGSADPAAVATASVVPAAAAAVATAPPRERRRSSMTSAVVRKVLERLQSGGHEWLQIERERAQEKEREKDREKGRQTEMDVEARQERQERQRQKESGAIWKPSLIGCNGMKSPTGLGWREKERGSRSRSGSLTLDTSVK